MGESIVRRADADGEAALAGRVCVRGSRTMRMVVRLPT